MAQTVQLNVAIKTREGVRTLKQLRGSIQEVRDQIKNFKTDAIANEFKDVNRVIDITNSKLDKFGKNLDNRRLSMLFQNSGGSTILSGTSVGGRGSAGGGANNTGTNLVSIMTQMQRTLAALLRSVDLIGGSLTVLATSGGLGRGRGGFGGTTSAAGVSPLGRAGGQVAGALGFGVIDAATQVKAIFADKRVKNAFSDGASNLFGLLGGIFGDAIGSIASDVGRAFGELAEIAFNAFTLNIRLLGLSAAGFLKGVGVALGLSLFGGFTAITGGLGGVVLGAIAILTGALTSLVNQISELFNEALDIIQSLFKAAFAVISATIKTLTTIFRSVGKVITAVWMGLWEGIKGIATASVTSLKEVIGGLGSAFASLARQGLKSFASLQQGAIRGNKEIADTAGVINEQFEDIIRNVSSRSGASTSALSDLFFSSASRGLLRRAGGDAAAQFERFSNAIADAANADFADVNNVGNAAISVMENFGIAVSDVTRVTDLLNRTTTLGSTTMDELSSALANVLPSAANLGFGLEDTLAAVARITQVLGPGKAKNATRILNRFFEGIAIPTDRARKTLERLGVQFDQIFDKSGKARPDGFNQLFGQIEQLRQGLDDGGDELFRELFPLKQARQAFLAVSGDLEKLKSIREDIETIPIEPQREFALSGLLKQTQILQKTFENINEKVLGAFQGRLLQSIVVSDDLIKVLQKVQRFTTSSKFNAGFDRIIKGVAEIFGGLEGRLVRVGNRIGSAFKKIISGDFDNTIGRIAELMSNALNSVLDFVDGFLTVENVNSLLERSLDAIDLMIAQLPKVGQLLRQIFAGDFGGAVRTSGNIFGALFGFAPSDVFNQIVSVLGGAIETAVMSGALAIDEFIQSFSTGIFSSLSNSSFLNTFVAAGKLIAVSFALKFLEVVQQLLPIVGQLVTSVFQSDNKFIRTAVDNLISAANTLMGVFKFGAFIFDFVINPLKEAFSGLRIVFNELLIGFKELFGAVTFKSDEEIRRSTQPQRDALDKLSTPEEKLSRDALIAGFKEFNQAFERCHRKRRRKFDRNTGPTTS